MSKYCKIIKPCFSFDEVGDILKIHASNDVAAFVRNADLPRPDDYEDADYEWAYDWGTEVIPYEVDTEKTCGTCEHFIGGGDWGLCCTKIKYNELVYRDTVADVRCKGQYAEKKASEPAKKTVVFDFDGVIHSYTSGWKGASVIPDPPVPGIKEAIDQFVDKGYDVVVVSTRCASPLGFQAVRDYLMKHEIQGRVMTEKPPAVCYIDDRAVCFDGHPENLFDTVENFVPWNRKEESTNVSDT